MIVASGPSGSPKSMWRKGFEKLMGVLSGDSSDSDAMDRRTDDLLESMDAHIHDFEDLVRPSTNAPSRTRFQSNIPANQSGPALLSLSQLVRMLPVMVPLMSRMKKSARLYDPAFEPKNDTASDSFLKAFEQRARTLGAKDIGYVRVPHHAIFRDKGIPYRNAVVFTVEMDKEAIDSSPSFESLNEVMRGYNSLARIGNKLAQVLRSEGFAACPGTALGGLTDYPHLAELAGLGAIGYHGLLITPGEGARLRINTIYTNIRNLPVRGEGAPENEHLWVRDFCSKCKRCIRACPVNAIFDEPRPRADGGMQTLENATCRDYFAINYSCAICLARCPFSELGYDAVKERFAGNPDAPQFRLESSAALSIV